MCTLILMPRCVFWLMFVCERERERHSVCVCVSGRIGMHELRHLVGVNIDAEVCV